MNPVPLQLGNFPRSLKLDFNMYTYDKSSGKVIINSQLQSEQAKKEPTKEVEIKPTLTIKAVLYLYTKYYNNTRIRSYILDFVKDNFAVSDLDYKDRIIPTTFIVQALQSGSVNIAKLFGVTTQSVVYWMLYFSYIQYLPESIQVQPQVKPQVTELSTNRSDLMELHEQVKMKIDMLRNAMVKETPELPTILQQIRFMLGKDESCVMNLEESDIEAIVTASMVHSRTRIIEAAKAGKGSNKKSLKDLDVEDLM